VPSERMNSCLASLADAPANPVSKHENFAVESLEATTVRVMHVMSGEAK
jgi:hypothetical protein